MGIRMSWVAIRPANKKRVFNAFKIKKIPGSMHETLSKEFQIWGRSLFDGWYLLEADSKCEILDQKIISELSFEFEVLSGYRIDGASATYLDEWVDGNKLWSVSNDNKLTVTGIPPFELEGIIENYEIDSPDFRGDEIPLDLSNSIIGYSPYENLNEIEAVDYLTWKSKSEPPGSNRLSHKLTEKLKTLGFRFEEHSMMYEIGNFREDYLTISVLCAGIDKVFINLNCTFTSLSVREFLESHGLPRTKSVMMFPTNYIGKELELEFDMQNIEETDRKLSYLVETLEQELLPSINRLFQNKLSEKDYEFFFRAGQAEYSLISSLLICNRREEASILAKRYSETPRNTDEYKDFLSRVCPDL